MDKTSVIAVLEKVFCDDYQNLKGKRLRMTRLRIPGKEICLAEIISPMDERVYTNLGLNIGVHEGEDHNGEAVGLIRFTPWEAVVAAADYALKSADVQIGFMDRFNGSLILTGSLIQVRIAVDETVSFFKNELGFYYEKGISDGSERGR